MDSTFSNKFTENLLPLLITLFAINIASSTLIAGKIRELQEKTGVKFEKTKRSLKETFFEQLFIIGIVLVVALLRESKVLQTSIDISHVHLYCDALLFGCFIYYVDIIRDIGMALFKMLD